MSKQKNHPLRIERLLRGWSQQQLADFARISLNSVARAERGEPLRVDICRLLCNCLGKEKPEDLGLRVYGLPDDAISNGKELQQQLSLQDQTSATSVVTSQNEPIAEPLVLFTAYHPDISISTREQIYPFEEQDTANSPESLLYDDLETAIMKIAIAWKGQQTFVYPLQTSVQIAFKDFDSMAQPIMTDETKVSRRYALKAIARLPIQAYSLSALGLGCRLLPPAEELLPLYAAGMMALRTLSRENDLTLVEHVLADYLPVLKTLVDQSALHQREAAALLAQGYLLMGLVADCQGKLDLMEKCSCIARNYAQMAQDPNIEASALVRLAVKYDYQGRDIKALHTYQEAVALQNFSHLSPLMQGRIYAGLAATHAYCKQEHKALYFLGLAKDTFPINFQDDPSFQFAFVGPSTMPQYEGLVRKHIGQYAQAWETVTLLGQFQPVPGLLDRNRTEFLEDASSVALMQGELATSFTYLKAAEDLAWKIKNEQRYTEVMETYRLMEGLYPLEQATRDMREIINSRHRSQE